MQEKSLSKLSEKYELELPKIIKTIKKEKAKLILLQFPDAIKPYATEIASEIEKKSKCQCLIWLGSCFGACDLPLQVQILKPKIDLIIQFGHSTWNYKKKNIKVLK